MGYRTILSSEKVINLKNMSSEGLGVSGAFLSPGASKDVSAWVFTQDKFRSEELRALVRAGRVQATLKYGGYSEVLGMDQMLGMESPIPTGQVKQVAAIADLPAADVPGGYMAYDVGAGVLYYNDIIAAVPTWVAL